MGHAVHHLPTMTDLVELAGRNAFPVARARLHAAIAAGDFSETEHYSALCRNLIVGGWATSADHDLIARSS
jgi:hypothetical protein